MTNPDKILAYAKITAIVVGGIGAIAAGYYVYKIYSSAKQKVSNAAQDIADAAAAAGDTVVNTTDSTVIVEAAKDTAKEIVTTPAPLFMAFTGPFFALPLGLFNLINRAYDKAIAPVCDGVISPFDCFVAGVETPVKGQNSYRIIQRGEAGIVAAINILDRMGYKVWINGDGWITKVQ